MRFRYALALGSNRRTRHGSPFATVRAAVHALHAAGFAIQSASPIYPTLALGPAERSFANAAVLIGSDLAPPALLACLNRIEQEFGRRPGRRWGPRALDLDILLWSGGRWPSGPRNAAAGRLAIPHRALADRRFVLDPLVRIAPGWRVPPAGTNVRQLRSRLVRRLSRAPADCSAASFGAKRATPGP